MDPKFVNVLILGFGFMFMFTAFQTMGNIEKTILDSIAVDDPTFTGDGYTSLAIIYGVFSLFNWFTPSALAYTGPRGAIVIGAISYCLFMITFLWPQTWLLYCASAMLGVGAALTWTGQGTYLSRCSDSTNISRNSSIFWAMLQASMFFGNLFVYFQFAGKTHIDGDTRQFLFTVLIGVAIVGIVFLSTLRHVNEPIATTDDSPAVADNKTAECDDEDEDRDAKHDDIVGVPAKRKGFVSEFLAAIKLFSTRDMLLLSITFFYTGLELSFFSGVYSPSIGFTTAIGPSAKQLVGLSGICIGLGEVFGGITFGLLAKKFAKYGRDPIVIFGYAVHVISFFMIFMNLPNDAPLGETEDIAYLDPPRPSIALVCSFLLGLGDACFNTQIYSILGGVYAKESTAAFALFKFTQSVAAAMSFVYSSHLGLGPQMIILLVFGTIGTLSFCAVELLIRRRTMLIDDVATVIIEQYDDLEEKIKIK